MEQTQILPTVQYLTQENGQRVGVVLAWEDFRNIQARLTLQHLRQIQQVN